MVRPKHQRLDAIIEGGHRTQGRLHRVLAGHVAAGQHGQCPEAERAAQELATVDLGEERLVVLENALIDSHLGPELRRRRAADRHASSDQCAVSGAAASGGLVGVGSTRGPPVIIAPMVFGTIRANAT